MKDFLCQVFTILWKDILFELRTRDTITAVLVFALLVIVIFNFAFEPEASTMLIVAPGVLWVSFIFAGVLSLNRTFVLEKEKGCLEGLMLCPVSREAIYTGKMLSSLIFMLTIEAIILPVFFVLFNLSVPIPMYIFVAEIGLVTLLTTIGFATVGTLFSAMSANTKAREVMLPILLFPVVSPIIIAAVESTGIILEGGYWGDFSSWLGILVAFDAIFLAVSPLAFEFVIQE